MLRNEIVVLPSAVNMAEFLTTLFRDIITTKVAGEFMTVALSGGKTPERIFAYISSHDKESVSWERIRFFWVDERCVPPSNIESNFRMIQHSLFNDLNVPPENIFRIHGEANPAAEARRYSRIISRNVSNFRNVPQFDLILLGLGEDGHTASIFPGNLSLFQSGNYCEAATHPQTGQQRITMTGLLLNNAKNVVFMVTGTEKAKIVAEVRQDIENSRFPASRIRPAHGCLTWLLDADAAGVLNPEERTGLPDPDVA